jgi:uncharacterized membrane protein
MADCEGDDGPVDGPDAAELGAGLLEAEMGPSSAMAHLYRGEVHRMKLWRERLDRTTNWAVIVLAAVLTWAFSSHENPHYIVLVGVAAVTLFLFIEARRYRGYDMWRGRVRLLQENVFAYALDPDCDLPDREWRHKLSEDYLSPRLKMTTEAALAHRLRRVYLPLLGILLAAWLVRITAFADNSWPESAAVGHIPGIVVCSAVAAFALVVLVIALRPREWTGELIDEEPDAWD